MKTSTLLLATALAKNSLNTMAQGTINANNIGSGVNILIASPTLNGGAAVPIGVAATAAGFVGAGPGQVFLALYGALNGTSLATLESPQSLLATGYNSTSTFVSGTESFGNPFVLPTAPGVFDGSAQDEFIWYGATSAPYYIGAWSEEATGITPATGATVPTTIFGTSPGLIGAFSLVPIPEPSNYAIAGFGVAVLLLLRPRSPSTLAR